MNPQKAYSPGPDVAVLECLPAETDLEIKTAPIVQGECYLDKNFMRVRVPCPFCGEIHTHGRVAAENCFATRWSHCKRSQGYKAKPYRIQYAESYETAYAELLRIKNDRSLSLKSTVKKSH